MERSALCYASESPAGDREPFVPAMKMGSGCFPLSCLSLEAASYNEFCFLLPLGRRGREHGEKIHNGEDLGAFFS